MAWGLQFIVQDPRGDKNQGQEVKGGAVKAPEIHTRHVVKMTRRDGLERLGAEYCTSIWAHRCRRLLCSSRLPEAQCGDNGSLVAPPVASTAAPNF